MLAAPAILIISSESDHRQILAALVSEFGLHPVCCGKIADAKALMARQGFSTVLCEDTLPDGDFRSAISEMRRLACSAPVIVVSERQDWDFYLTTVGAGAFEYVAFPPEPGELERVLWAAVSEWKRCAGSLGESAA